MPKPVYPHKYPDLHASELTRHLLDPSYIEPIRIAMQALCGFVSSSDNPKFLSFAPRDPGLLDPIIVAGYPFGDSLSPTIKVTRGVVSSLAARVTLPSIGTGESTTRLVCLC